MSSSDSRDASSVSLPRVRSPISDRSSASLDHHTQPTVGPSQRRNRAALRDYYGIKAAGPNGTPPPEQRTPPPPTEPQSELDKPGFDAQRYVDELLAKEGLEGVLQTETGLVSDIRGFDGERKALVYDNYSKLIAATDTIKRMRENMDPLAPITSTLEPAVAHIADTAGVLSRSLGERIGEGSAPVPAGPQGVEAAKVQTVKWVLDTPRRLEALVREGRREDAQADWADVDLILDKWSGVKGVEQVREQARAALAG